MARERFVLLGLARARSLRFRAVAQWATSAAIPAEFVKCVSGEELRAHLASGRAYSAVLLDAGLPSVDRDLVQAARQDLIAANRQRLADPGNPDLVYSGQVFEVPDPPRRPRR